MAMTRMQVHVPEAQMDDPLTDRPQRRLPSRHHKEFDNPFLKTVYRTWSDLPSELRNLVYERCLLYEGLQVYNVRHYPHGFRRSGRNGGTSSNFSKSFWGFTQVNRQVRAEFAPWLLKQRRVSTPLATLNAYVGIFHPVDKQTGARTGWIEPIEPDVSGLPLCQDGVEILDLIKHNRFDSNFHLELHPEPTDISPQDFDELDILYRLNRNINFQGTLLQACGITSIMLIPIPAQSWDYNSTAVRFSVKPNLKQKFMIRLDIQPTTTVDGNVRTVSQQGHCLEYWLYEEACLTSCQYLHIQAIASGYEAMWKVLMPDLLFRKWEKHDGKEDHLQKPHILRRKVWRDGRGDQLITIETFKAKGPL